MKEKLIIRTAAAGLVIGCVFIAAALFGIVAFSIFTGHPLNALAKTLPFFAYPFFAATLLGWAWTPSFRLHKFQQAHK